MNAITRPELIEAFRMKTLLVGLRLEIKGMARKGKSCYAIIKDEYQLTGTRQQVYDKFAAMHDEAKTKIGAMQWLAPITSYFAQS